MINHQSEVARLTEQISAEYASADAALHAMASGVARHAVIAARMSRAQRSSQELIEAIGYDAAKPLIVAAMEGTPS